MPKVIAMLFQPVDYRAQEIWLWWLSWVKGGDGSRGRTVVGEDVGLLFLFYVVVVLLFVVLLCKVVVLA